MKVEKNAPAALIFSINVNKPLSIYPDQMRIPVPQNLIQNWRSVISRFSSLTHQIPLHTEETSNHHYYKNNLRTQQSRYPRNS